MNQQQKPLLSDPDIRGVAVHLVIYLCVNALLIGIDVIQSPENLWFFWPLLGWGIGLAGHAWLAYRAVLRKTMEYYAAEQQTLTEMKLERQAAEIAAAVEPPKKKTPVTRKRRKQAAAKTTKKRAARRGTAAKRAPKKRVARKKS